MGRIVIKNEREMNETKFENLEPGTVFRTPDNEELFIKIDTVDHRNVCKFNCVSIDGFMLRWIVPTADVHELPAELIIK